MISEKDFLNLIASVQEYDSENDPHEIIRNHGLEKLQEMRLSQNSHTHKLGSFTLVSRSYDKIFHHVSIYEDKPKISKINVFKDKRFASVDWKGYFNQTTKVGNKIPENKYLEIKKYLEKISKLKAFI